MNYFIITGKQFIKFGIVGVLNTLIGLGIYYIFIYISVSLYIAGNTVGFIAGVLNSYYWNNKYVFNKSEEGHLKPLLKTFIAYGGTLILGTILLIIMVQVMHISEWVAPLINLFITVPLNFLMNKFWAFK
ncbi:MAG TPA: GtrA family protein [Spirochaetota bacterium]|nr:GtrA family protein [Spirochaetota bacterium]